ncbi:uncharacterized protein LOC144367330 isoform X2 [Ictidomys tridecemlineatus]
MELTRRRGRPPPQTGRVELGRARKEGQEERARRAVTEPPQPGRGLQRGRESRQSRAPRPLIGYVPVVRPTFFFSRQSREEGGMSPFWLPVPRPSSATVVWAAARRPGVELRERSGTLTVKINSSII